MRPWTLVGFVGHRRLEDIAETRGAVEAALNRLRNCGLSELAAVSSIAAGADILFAEAVLARKMPWLAHLPFALEKFQEDFAPAEWKIASQLLARAVSIQTESSIDDRNEAFLECGVRIVDECDVLIAVWNGCPAIGLGGTGDIIAYARSLGKPLLWIHSRTLAITESSLDKLPRACAGNPTLNPGKPEVTAEFARLDHDATHGAPEAKQLTVSVILLHLLATGAVTLALTMGMEGFSTHFASGFEIACLCFSLVLVFRHQRAHHHWIGTRISAEICRSALATWDLPASGRTFPKVNVRGYERLQTDLRISRLVERPECPDLSTARDLYLSGRVQNQIEYFSRQIARAAPRLRLLRLCAISSTVGAILIGSFALGLSLCGIGGKVYAAAKTLSLLLPLFNAALLSYIVAHDLTRRVSRYREMIHTLRQLERRLAHARSWGSLDRLVTATEETLIQEVLEWHCISRFSSDLH